MPPKKLSAASILLADRTDATRRRDVRYLILLGLALGMMLEFLNIYLTYQPIFDFFNQAKNVKGQLVSNCTVSAFGVALALKYPFLKLNFFNPNTPEIIHELVYQSTCYNPNQCASCLSTLPVQPRPLPNAPPYTCESGCPEPYCVIRPEMLCSNLTNNNFNYLSDDWQSPTNPYGRIIQPTAPIVQKKNTDDMLNALFTGGFTTLAERSNMTVGDFWQYVFGQDQPKPPCKKNYLGFAAGIASGVVNGAALGAMAGGGPAGAVVVGLIMGGIGFMSSFKDITC